MLLPPLLYTYGYMSVHGVSEQHRANEACHMPRSPIFQYTHMPTEAEEGVLLVA